MDKKKLTIETKVLEARLRAAWQRLKPGDKALVLAAAEQAAGQKGQGKEVRG
jgi:hypothetical protein